MSPRNKALFMILSLVFFSGCARNTPPEKSDIIAYVNKEPVYESDLRKEIFLRGRNEPGFRYSQEAKNKQLNIMINKKIVIQEAMKKGLSRTERFASTMKAFWEQILVRDFIEMKKVELGKKVAIKPETIKNYYDKLSGMVTFRVLKSDNASYIEDAYNKYMKKEALGPLAFETLGPVGYDEISSPILTDAFNLPVEGAKIYQDEPESYLIIVDKIEKRDVKPYDMMKAEIEKALLDRAESDMFERWLKSMRKKAKVDIVKQ